MDDSVVAVWKLLFSTSQMAPNTSNNDWNQKASKFWKNRPIKNSNTSSDLIGTQSRISDKKIRVGLYLAPKSVVGYTSNLNYKSVRVGISLKTSFHASFPDDNLLCRCKCLKAYEALTSSFRPSDPSLPNKLFLAIINFHKARSRPWL
jgi:hypothetical protein